jgi:hypothetical protein
MHIKLVFTLLHHHHTKLQKYLAACEWELAAGDYRPQFTCDETQIAAVRSRDYELFLC